jgi:transcriptional regulator with XRE-family HTH domain
MSRNPSRPCGKFSIMENEERYGPLTRQVAANARRIRERRGLTLANVAERMAALGRPMTLNGVSKIERGNRGVDLDDVAALARALDVAPLLLILPVGHEPAVELFPDAAPVSTWESARWFTGESGPPTGIPSWGPFANVDWPDLAVRHFRLHEQLADDWTRSDDDVQRAADNDARSGAERRRRNLEDYLREHRAEMRRLGMEHLPPVPAPLRARLADKEGGSDGER